MSRLVSVFRAVLLACLVVLPARAAEPLRVIVCGGLADGATGVSRWTNILSGRDATVERAFTFPTAEQLAAADVLFLLGTNAPAVTGEGRDSFETFLARGGGVVAVGDAIQSPDAAWWKSILGGAAEMDSALSFDGPVSIYFTDHSHAISDGVSNWDFDDRIRWGITLLPEAKILASSYAPDKRNTKAGRALPSIYDIAPQLWTLERKLPSAEAAYRAFVSIPGRGTNALDFLPLRAVLLRGIAWAGRRDIDSLCDKDELASLRYHAGGPTAPDHAAQLIKVQSDFTLQLVAAEPLLNKPISLDWDSAGRLWIAETPEYPFRRTASGPTRDRISILVDADSDGSMERKTVFHEGLHLVTSLVFHRDGVIVAQAPDILWLRDTDGDGKADKTTRLFTGFGTNDTHAVLSNLRRGLDGWIYGTVGYSRGDIFSGDRKKPFGKITDGVFRFRPDGSAMEQVSSKASNTWGVDLAPDGEIFFSQANGNHINHVVLPESALARGRVTGTASFKTIEDHKRAFPLREAGQQAYAQIDFVGGFTAASGACLYDGGAWPEKYNRAFLVTEPTLNLVHLDFLRPDGVSYVASRDAAHADAEFLASTDLWFRPIHVRVGPDGALYLLDFYNQAAVHNDPRGPRHDPLSNAAIRPDRDRYFGRIWRIQHRDAKKLPPAALAKAGTEQLAAALAHPNGWTRATAARLLVEKNDPATAEALQPLVRSLGFRGLDEAKAAALWLLHQLGQLEHAVLTEAIATDGKPIIQKNALRIAAERVSKTGAPRAAAASVPAFPAGGDAIREAHGTARAVHRAARADYGAAIAANGAAVAADGAAIADYGAVIAFDEASIDLHGVSVAGYGAVTDPHEGSIRPDEAAGELHGGAPPAAASPGAVTIARAENTGGAPVSTTTDPLLTAVLKRARDPHPRVRLEALAALGVLPLTDEVRATVVALYPDLSDPWMESAALGIASRAPTEFIRSAATSAYPSLLADLVSRLSAQIADQQDAAAAARVIVFLADRPEGADALKRAALEAFAKGLKDDVAPAWNEELESAFKTLFDTATPIASAALPLAARWDKNGALGDAARKLTASLLERLKDDARSDEARGQLLPSLLAARRLDTNVLPAAAALLGPDESTALRRQAVEALASLGDAAATKAILEAAPKLPTDLFDFAVSQLLRRADSSLALLDGLQSGTVRLATLGPALVHRLRTHGDKAVSRRAAEVLDALRGPEEKEKNALLAQYTPEVEKPGNATAGKELFAKNCAVCHKFNGEGKDTAPDLTGMGAHGPAELLVHILDPNRVVEPNYVAVNIETKDDQSYSAIVVRENKAVVVIRDANGETEIKTGDITHRASSGRSLMPEGFESLGADGLRDLMAFLCAKEAKYRLVDLGAGFTADSTRGMFDSAERVDQSLAFKRYGIVKAGDVPFEVVSPSRTASNLNVTVLRGGKGFSKALPRRVELRDLGLRATKLHFLGGVGAYAWPWGGTDKNEGLLVARVTVSYADGQQERFDLTNGVVFVDYANVDADVTGSKRVPGLLSRGQLRTFSRTLTGKGPVERIALESFDTSVVPVFVALTAENAPIAGDKPEAPVTEKDKPPAKEAKREKDGR